MKTAHLLLLCITISLHCIANPVFDRLVAVNSYWKEQPDVASIQYPVNENITDREWIIVHLSLVEKILRARDVSRLTVAQRANRQRALDHLHRYWEAGNFPINDEYSYKTPIFIDRHDNFCAVGYLVKATGYERVSRMIASKTNLAYVEDMQYPELFAWAKEYGFTIAELEWIQPTYSPCGAASEVAKGVNGVVYELFADSAAQRLYVGGSFNMADSSITANNIAYVTESGGTYTWHAMGSGVHGTVKAICNFGSNVFVGGVIDSASGAPVTNIAYYDGSNWHAAGCLNGVVRDMIVYKDSLYACGTFGVCPAQNAGNFAVWTGPATGWRQIGALAGDLNTMIIKDSLLYIGGGFSYMGKVANVVSWHRSSGFDTFATHLNNEVMDFEVYLDTLYASCKLTSPNDHHLISRLINGTWDTSRQVNLDADLVLSVNAICANRDTFIAGGDFHYYPTVMGTEVRDMVDISYLFQSIPRYYLPCVNFISDSTVYCMTRFRNKIFLGGTFTRSTKPYTYVNTNGISTLAIPYWHMFPLKVKIDSIFQGCTKNRLGEVKLDVSGDSPIRLLWSTGDTASFNNVYSSYPVYKDSLVTGSYWLRVQDKWGQVDTFRFTIKNEAVDTAVSLINGYFVKALSGARLQWLDCDNHFNAITGATKPTFKPTVTGNYAVAISVDGCLDTSYCHSYKVTGIKDVQEMSAVLYPNPVTDLLNVSFDHLIIHAVMDIIDVTGRSVAKQVINNSNEAVVNTRLFVKGVYTVVIRQDGLEPYYMRFIKE